MIILIVIVTVIVIAIVVVIVTVTVTVIVILIVAVHSAHGLCFLLVGRWLQRDAEGHVAIITIIIIIRMMTRCITRVYK